NAEFTQNQKRAVAVVTVIAILFGVYFLRGFFILIVVAAIGAYLFTPLFKRLTKRFSRGLSATLTLLAALASVVIPAAAFVLLAFRQATTWVRRFENWIAHPDLSSLGDKTLRVINETLARVPFLPVTVTPESLRKSITAVTQHAGQWLLQILQTAAGSVIG